MTDTKHFLEKTKALDFAFQPIVDIHTREIYAVEALLRNVETIGFGSIHHFFDTAYRLGLLYAVDLLLREKAIKKFTQLENCGTIKLFYNLDNRLLDMEDYTTGNTEAMLKASNVDKSALCFEISERHEVTKEGNGIIHILEHYKKEGFQLAIDDFGIGFCREFVALLLQFRAQFDIIENFAIEHDPDRSIFVVNRLISAAQIDNAESGMGEPCRSVHKYSA